MRHLPALLLGLVAVTFALTSAPANARPHVYALIAGYDLETKPRNWTSAGLGASAYIEDLTWRRWGRATANGKGTARNNDCRPSCAEGRQHYYPGRLRLSRIKPCKGSSRLFYTRALYRMRVPADNPFALKPGWRTKRFELPASSCRLSSVEKARPAKKPNRTLYDGRFLIRPDALSTEPLAVFDEKVYRASGLSWTRWGVTAVGRGVVEHCVADSRPCEARTGKVKLGGLYRYGCNFRIIGFEYYSRVRFEVDRSDGHADSGWLPLQGRAGIPCQNRLSARVADARSGGDRRGAAASRGGLRGH